MRVESIALQKRFVDADRVVEVFNDLSFVVPSGSSFGIVGESGCGKTTLLNILGTLDEATAGTVLLGEEEVRKREGVSDQFAEFRSMNIGFIFQFFQLLPEFDAVENVAMPLLIQGLDAAEARLRASELLDRVGLCERLTHRPGELSGGEQQRVAIARALVTEPGLVLADEPTGNLDLRTGEGIQKLLLDIQSDLGMTLIVVTHSPDLASALDNVLELTSNGGQVVD